MKEWLYLETLPFKSRVILAANWLQDCDHILDIGGYRTPIYHYLDPKNKVVVIDPRIDDRALMNWEAIKGRWQDHFFEAKSSQGFVCLGLEIHAPEKDWSKFISFIDGCQRAVIGVASDHIHSVNQFERIEAGLTKLELKYTVGLDLSGNDFSGLKDSAPPYTNRRLYFFEKGS